MKNLDVPWCKTVLFYKQFWNCVQRSTKATFFLTIFRKIHGVWTSLEKPLNYINIEDIIFRCVRKIAKKRRIKLWIFQRSHEILAHTLMDDTLMKRDADVVPKSIILKHLSLPYIIFCANISSQPRFIEFQRETILDKEVI